MAPRRLRRRRHSRPARLGGSEPSDRALIHYRRVGFPPGRVWVSSPRRCTTARRLCGRGVSRCEELLLEERDAGRIGRANIYRYLGGLMAMADDSRMWRAGSDEACGGIFDDLGQTGAARYCDALLADVELLAGDVRCGATCARGTLPATARRARISDCSDLRRRCWPVAVTATRTVTTKLERWLAAAPRHAAPMTTSAPRFAWRSASAKVARTARGRPRPSMSRGGRASLAGTTDALNARAAAFMARAEVLALMGQHSTMPTRRSPKPSRSTSRRETSLLSTRSVIARREAPLGASRPNSLSISHGRSASRRAAGRVRLTRRAGTPLTSQPARR